MLSHGVSDILLPEVTSEEYNAKLSSFVSKYVLQTFSGSFMISYYRTISNTVQQ